VKQRAFFLFMLLIGVLSYQCTQALAAGATFEQDVLRLFIPEAARVLHGEGYEISSGFGDEPQCRSTYTSIVWAFGLPTTEEGFRLRSTEAMGDYHFVTRKKMPDGSTAPAPKVGKSHFADTLMGYAMNYGSLWISAFGGVAYEERVMADDGAPPGETERVRQRSLASEVALDVWLRVDDVAWFSANANYVTDLGAAKASVSKGNSRMSSGSEFSAQQYSTTVRSGVRTVEFIGFALDLGPEAVVTGDAESWQSRAGGFAKVNYWGTELTVSSGMEGDGLRPKGNYASASVFKRF
jgi:hypothetical protein